MRFYRHMVLPCYADAVCQHMLPRTRNIVRNAGAEINREYNA